MMKGCPAVCTNVCGRQLVLHMVDARQTVLVNVLATIQVNVAMLVFLTSMGRIVQHLALRQRRATEKASAIYRGSASASKGSEVRAVLIVTRGWLGPHVTCRLRAWCARTAG